MIKLGVFGLALVILAGPVMAAEVSAVASFSILGDMVRRVGGERVGVTVIVGPNADAHIYEPKPADAVAVNKAQIFFVNGLGLEGWLDRLVQSTRYAGLVVQASTGISQLQMNEGGQDVTDPHAWQSLRDGLVYVSNIAAGLCAVDEAGCAIYWANAARYSDDIKALDAKIRADIEKVPIGRRKVITSHDAFGYFGAEYRVTFLAPEGISTESEASAGAVGRLITQIRNEAITALFIETMSDTRLIAQVAKDAGVRLGGELYSDALSQPGQGAASYLEMMAHNAGLLVPAMLGQ